MRSRRTVLICLSAALLAAPATPACAQMFGKNKVQYDALEWAVLETPHVRLHFYSAEEGLARRLAAAAESVCVEYDGRFRLAPRSRVPLLLYSAHHLFQQTNATPGMLGEGVGGLTELIKGRVLIPHNGSWARLEWVTRHELAHWYMLEKLQQVMHAHHRTRGGLPPLWFIEGFAEYCGTRWDADAEGLLRDAMVTGEALPLTRSDAITGTVLMYKEGQSFLLYLAERFGPERVFDLLDAWWRGDEFESVFRLTFGESLQETDDAWFSGLKRRYYPAVREALPAGEAAVKLTRRGLYNLGPSALPGRTVADTALRFCFFAAGEDGIDLMLSLPVAGGGRREVRLARGGLSPRFESFHLFQNRPDASRSGLIALSSKRGGRDALYVVDASRRRVIRRLGFPRLVNITNPSLVPGDSAMVFSGQDYGGSTDLYRATWGPGRRGPVRLDRMTHDDWDDQEPDVSPDGRWVVFASDRGSPAGEYSLWRISLADGVLERVSVPPGGEDRQPRYSPDGRWIAFRSTRGGTSDLWVRSAEPGREVRRATRLLGPASDPDWLPSGGGLLFTAQEGITFQTYALRCEPDSLPAEYEPGPELAAGGGAPPERAAMEPKGVGGRGVAVAITGMAPVPRAPAVADPSAPRRYERRLSLDIVQTAVGTDPALGAGGAGQVALSDVFGNEQVNLFLANDLTDGAGSFWDGLEAGVTYLNLSRRFNWGVGVYRLVQTYDADLNAIRLERRVGMSLLARYPFDKFTRIEGSLLLRRALDHLRRDGGLEDVDLVSNFVSLVYDNATWSLLGASTGTRLALSAGYTRDMGSGASDYGTLLAEARRYMRPFRDLVSSTRLQAQASVGQDAQRFYLGGHFALRGYDPRTLAGVRTVLVQQELRFPLVRRMTLALPTRWEFPPVGGAAFADAGWAWGGGRVPSVLVPGYYFSGWGLGPEGQGHLGSVGLGFFIGGGPFPVLRWNYIWPTSDFRRFARRPRTQFLIGYNF